jgi:hypothetical protein
MLVLKNLKVLKHVSFPDDVNNSEKAGYRLISFSVELCSAVLLFMCNVYECQVFIDYIRKRTRHPGNVGHQV